MTDRRLQTEAAAEPEPPTWTIVARSEDVDPGPVPGELAGRPIVIWRGRSGRVSVLDDSCPHQGTQLSFGTVVGEQLLCRQHGWAIDRDGWCEQAAAGARAFKAEEADGVVRVRDDGRMRR